MRITQNALSHRTHVVQVQRGPASGEEQLWMKVLAIWTCVSLTAATTQMYLGPPFLPFLILAALVSLYVGWFWHPRSIPNFAWLMLPILALNWLLLQNINFRHPYWIAVLATALACVGWLVASSHSLRGARAGRLLIVLGCVTVLIGDWRWGHAVIDVFGVMQNGSIDLVHGIDPYFATFHSNTLGVKAFHYSYGPIMLLLGIPFAFLGDVRLLLVASAASFVALVGWHDGRSRLLSPMVLVLLLSPWLVWTIVRSWNELLVVAMLLWWFVLAQRGCRWCWVLIGLSIGVTPVAFIVLAPVFLLYQELRRDVLLGTILSAIIYLTAVAIVGLKETSHVVRILASIQYNFTWGLGGIFHVLTGHPFGGAEVLVLFGVILGTTFVMSKRLQSQRDLAAGVVMCALVLCLAATYFEYVVIPAIWIWWWLVQRAPPHHGVERSAASETQSMFSGEVARTDV